LGLTDISASALLYAGQILFVPLQATNVSAIIAIKTSEMKNFLMVMIFIPFLLQ
jgi:hypothetical protein